MNVLILCEGESDRVILSQYFCHRFNFSYSKSVKSADGVGMDYQYTNADAVLTIRIVEGVEEFHKKLRDTLRENAINTGTKGQFTHIAVIADHDSDDENDRLLQKLNEVLGEYKLPPFQEGHWCHGTQMTEMKERSAKLELLFLSIPLETSGALETMLLSALEKTAPGRYYLAKESRQFVDALIQNRKEHSMPYLSSRGDQVKAPLAVFYAVAAPRRIYASQQEILDMVNWGTFTEIQRTLQAFDMISRQMKSKERIQENVDCKND